jgi:Flp pilus assembly protein TadG
MVEFALFFIIFMMLAVGLMELGRAVWTYVTLSHAARAGGRYAIVHGGAYPISGDDLSIDEVVRQNAIGLNDGGVTVAVTYEAYDDDGELVPAANLQGHVVQVQVSYPFRFVAAGLIVPQSTVNMRSTARMTVLN